MSKLPFTFVLILFAAYGVTSQAKKQACIIGAGAAGLISARQLSAYPDEFEPIVFEKQSDVGGLWIYTDSTTVDDHGLPVHSGLYQHLRVNFPKEFATFPDYPEFRGDESKGSFVEHTQILQYLRNYTEHYNLRRFIQFNTNVEKVSPLSGMRWLITSQELNTKKRNEIQCDAVIVANGHNVKGNIPDIPGIESFPGRVIHSHTYRHAEEFADQTVVILGASFSGVDIGIQISSYAKKIYLSHRHDKMTAELPKNIEQARGVVAAAGGKLILSDGSRIKADALILCTGYVYDFPFLDASSGIVIEGGKYVRSVYKHLINIERPTMAILNLPKPGLPLLVPHLQVAYFIDILRGNLQLPSRQNMLNDATLPPGKPRSKAHYMVEEIILYYNDLASAAGYDLLPDHLVAIGLAILPQILGDPLHFRDKTLHFNADGSVGFD